MLAEVESLISVLLCRCSLGKKMRRRARRSNADMSGMAGCPPPAIGKEEAIKLCAWEGLCPKLESGGAVLGPAS